jgi:hypothetical protein
MKNISINAGYFNYLQPFSEMFFERAKRGISLCAELKANGGKKNQSEIPLPRLRDRNDMQDFRPDS